MTTMSPTVLSQKRTLLRDYLLRLDLPQHVAAVDDLTEGRVQSWLTRCRVLEAERLAALPAGRYALAAWKPGQQSVLFYKVDKPQHGKWAGYTFLKRQASDDLMPIKYAEKDAILLRIANDPQEAMERYGRELGACGHCGRTLTNEESRARGIGPVCAGKMGW